MSSRKRQITIPIFIPHAGCPHDCAFCDQRKISGNSSLPSIEAVHHTISSYLATAPEDSYIEIGFFGGTFTAIETDLQQMFLSVAREYLFAAKVAGIRLSTRPDAIDEAVVKRLKEYKVSTVELGVQSFDKAVLEASQRGHSVDHVVKAATLLKEATIDLGIQLMPGLPQSSEESDLDSAKEALLLEPSCMRIYPTVVLKDTKLASLYHEGLYLPLSLDEAVKRCARISRLCADAKVPIIRMGLHPIEMEDHSSIVAGPYHTAFGFLVKAENRYLDMRELVAAYCKKTTSAHSITLILPRICYEEYIGMRAENISKLEAEFRLHISYTKGDTLSIA